MSDNWQPVVEYDCEECGRHMVHLAGPRTRNNVCELCVAFPKWFRDPQARRILDPDGLAKPPREH